MCRSDDFPRDEASCFSSPTGYTAILDVDLARYPDLRDKAVVGYDGKLYDVSHFAKHHPGGEELLRMFAGKDVSMQVRAFHDRDVLSKWQDVGVYEDTTDLDPAAKGYKELASTLRSAGLFKTDLSWYGYMIGFAFCWLLLSLLLLRWDCYVASGLSIAVFWQQSGFMMHDFMHSQVTHTRSNDRWFGMLFGTTALAVDGHWWRDEHFVHHALTNTLDLQTKWSDPQMREDVWAQNRKLFPFYDGWLQYCLIKAQSFTWLPFTVAFGRLGITIDGFREEKRWYEWMSLGCHVAYIVGILSCIPTWENRGYWYLAASLGQGVLAVQLLLSHYAKPFFHKSNEYHNTAWPRVQCITTINIANHPAIDWFHGGLNIHIEHHLFPTLPRHNLRAAQVHVKRYCHEVGLVYDECCWSEAILRTLRHLQSEAGAMTSKQAV
ncbi:Sphingolipid 10-desaturase [Diplonema papillatum]|nr:Sphingolipid 10-desaturase [Diplonema papillatum]